MVNKTKTFNYTAIGNGEPMILLHGLFGDLSNWEAVKNYFEDDFRIIIPELPIYEITSNNGIEELTVFLGNFLDHLGINECILVGNSLGGHVAISFALLNPLRVKKLILTGSSGLYENSFGGSYPKRGNYDYVKERIEATFYDPIIASQELIDRVYEITKDNKRCFSIILTARSAQKNNLGDQLHLLKMPVLLIWGKQDRIAPPDVAEAFREKIPNAELHWIDRCGHAPMMEHPTAFNKLLDQFLR